MSEPSVVKVATDGRGGILDITIDRLPHPSTWQLQFGRDNTVVVSKGIRPQGRLSFPVEVEVVGKVIQAGDVVTVEPPHLTTDQKDALHVLKIQAAARALNEAMHAAYADGLSLRVNQHAKPVSNPWPLPRVSVSVSRPLTR